MDVKGAMLRLQGNLYRSAGKPFVFRNPITQKSVTLIAVDRTAAEIIDEKSLKIGALKPAATVLRSGLTALKIDPSAMVDVNVTFGGKNWRIMSAHEKPDPSWRVMTGQLRPIPNWETLGEILFMMMEVA
jgi:hypothetical protein